MVMHKVGLFWRTVKHLTVRQLVFQVVTRLQSRPCFRFPNTPPPAYFLSVFDADKPVLWQAGTFRFLNRPYSPGIGAINWNYRNAGLADYGKLWTYNLNYFDFLNQPGISPVSGLRLVQDFIDQADSLRDGLDPYPTSLRIINWVAFLSRNKVRNQVINRHLFAQVDLLSRRIEYHIAGNHLLENGYALLIGALYFRDKRWLSKATQLIHAELKRQILTDGGHYERSPMYHQLLLDRLLTVLLALQADSWHVNRLFVCFLTDKAREMLGWLNAITFSNGDVPMVNDCAPGIAPTTAQLRAKATRVLNEGVIEGPTARLHDSGYRMFRTARYELVADVGPIEPDHQPGHAHADTFSFILNVDNCPLLVDNGTSTYQPGPRRDMERSTAAHNTVEVNGQNSSEVWAGFRVGRRAEVAVVTDTPTELKALHNGYRKLGIMHERAWSVAPAHLLITDRLICSRRKADLCGVARFHFHPDVRLQLLDNRAIAGPLHLSFSSETKPAIRAVSYDLAEGFHQYRSGQCLDVLFSNRLETTIKLTE